MQKLLFTLFLSLFFVWGQSKTTQSPKNLDYFHKIQKEQKGTPRPFSLKGSADLLKKSLQSGKNFLGSYPKPLDALDIYVALSRVYYEKGDLVFEEIKLPGSSDSLVAILTPLLGAPRIYENSHDDGTPVKSYVWDTQKGYMSFEYLSDNKKYWNAISSTSALDTTGAYFLNLAFDFDDNLYNYIAMIVADCKLTTPILDSNFTRQPETGYYRVKGDKDLFKEDWANYSWGLHAGKIPLDEYLAIEVTERIEGSNKEEQIIRFIYGNL